MDEFERYLADLGRQNPHLSTLIEAVSDGYKICHPDEPDGIVKPHYASVGASSAILAKSAYLDRCYASESSSSCVMEAISNPHNLPNQKENSKKVRPGQVEEAKFIDGRILSRRIDTILNKSSLLQMVSSSNGSYTEIIGNALGMSTGASRYKLFYPNADKTDKREIRVSYHNVVLTNIPVNVGKAFCITFVRPDKEHLFQQENLLHNTIRHRNIDDTECLEYILYHSKLKSDVQCHTGDITQSLLYQVLKGVQENLTTGDVSQFPVSQQTLHNGESQNTDSPTTNNGKDNPLTRAVNKQPLTNLGESVMNTYQKSYTTFMESVCKQFNCPDALPALKEGFKAFCETSNAIYTKAKLESMFNASGDSRYLTAVIEYIIDKADDGTPLSDAEYAAVGLLDTRSTGYDKRISSGLAEKYDKLELPFRDIYEDVLYISKSYPNAVAAGKKVISAAISEFTVEEDN